MRTCSMVVSERNEKRIEKWTNGKFYGCGSCWFLETEEGRVELYRGDKVVHVGTKEVNGVEQDVFIATGVRRLRPKS